MRRGYLDFISLPAVTNVWRFLRWGTAMDTRCSKPAMGFPVHFPAFLRYISYPVLVPWTWVIEAALGMCQPSRPDLGFILRSRDCAMDNALSSLWDSPHGGRPRNRYGVWIAMAHGESGAWASLSRSLLFLVHCWQILGRRPVWNTVGIPWNDQRLVAFEC